MIENSNKEIHSKLSDRTSEFLLSIVVPTFNRKHELSQLLMQLKTELAECKEEVEIIVSDNNSFDDTGRVLERFVERETADIAIRCFTQTTNIGAIKNLHFLIAKSRGKHTWAMGDDDALVPGKVSEILHLLRTNSVDLLLVRTEGIGEWDSIPFISSEHTEMQIKKIGLFDEHSDDYLFAAGFLGSVIMNTKTWLDVSPKVEGLYETQYSNWAAVLMVASTKGEYFIIDEPCVKGNFNMQGESTIPAFNILVMGRIRVWSALEGSLMKKLLSNRIKELSFMGWVLVALGKTNDVVTLSDKLRAVGVTVSLLGPLGLRSYIFALVSILLPFPNILEKVRLALKAR